MALKINLVCVGVWTILFLTNFYEADAVSCYTDSGNVNNCNFCTKSTTYSNGQASVSKSCATLCVEVGVGTGAGNSATVYCCKDKDYCNSAYALTTKTNLIGAVIASALVLLYQRF